jgi:hypothetical protein
VPQETGPGCGPGEDDCGFTGISLWPANRGGENLITNASAWHGGPHQVAGQ